MSRRGSRGPVTFPPSKPALLHATYEGSDNFVVKGFDAAGNQGALFVNTIGNHDGVRLMNVTTDAMPSSLQVNANGPLMLAGH